MALTFVQREYITKHPSYAIAIGRFFMITQVQTNTIAETVDAWEKILARGTEPDIHFEEDILYHWQEVVREIENRGVNSDIAYSGLHVPDMKDSALDHAFYVYAVLRNGFFVFIGHYEGTGRKRAILGSQKRYEGTAAIILASGISQRKAKTMVQTIKRRLNL